MKKKFSFLIILFIISASNNIFSQKLSGYCPHKELTREFCRAADTIARFMDNIRNSSTDGAWDKFMEDAALGPVAAFNHFGDRAVYFRDTYNLLGNDLDKQARSLISAIDPGNSLTGEQVRDAMITRIICYYADTVENDLEKLVKDGGGPVLHRFADGPCEIAFRTCRTIAASNHMSQLIGCGFGAGNIWRWLGGWWGLGAGLLCLAGVENTYNNAKITCSINYCDCTPCD